MSLAPRLLLIAACFGLIHGNAAVTTRAQRPAAAAATAARVRALESLAPTYELACMMPPEVRQAQEGVCPKCGMPLSTVRPSVRGAYRLAVTQSPLAPKPGGRVSTVSFTVAVKAAGS